MKRAELYARVRHAVMRDGLSQREATRHFGIDPRTAKKMLSHSVPPSIDGKRICFHGFDAPEMTFGLDIYRAPNLLTERCGEDASTHAAMSADAMMEKGDLDGYAVWKLIMKAVDGLEAKERPGSA